MLVISNTSLSPKPCHLSEHDGVRLTESRLVYHFTSQTRTNLLLCLNPCVNEMWAVTVPRMAFECQHLLLALLGVSITMPDRTPSQPVPLLEQKDARALVMLARKYAITKLMDIIWWLHGIADYNLKDIPDMVPGTRWSWALAWPWRMQGYGIATSFD